MPLNRASASARKASPATIIQIPALNDHSSNSQWLMHGAWVSFHSDTAMPGLAGKCLALAMGEMHSETRTVSEL